MSCASVWTPERLQEAVAELGRETAIGGVRRRVAARLSARWGILVTPSGLERVFYRSGLGRLGQYVGRGHVSEHRDTEPSPATEPLPKDPVEVHHQRKAETRDKREYSALVERLAIAEERVRVLDSIGAQMPPIQIRRRERSSGLREATAIALASDWHVEETVEPDKVDGRNSYNLDISRARAARFFDGVEWLVGYHRQGFTVRDLVLWLGGDLMTGFIHEELMEGNGCSPTETVLLLRRMLSEGIKRLLLDPNLERIIIPCSYGNHGRTTEKRRIATGAQNSFEWLLYHVLATDFAEEPRVRFQIANGAHTYLEAYGFTLHFHHGDEISYGGGVGGISIPINKAVANWNTVRHADYHFFGHYHQRLEGRNWCANGSLIGYSPYAFSVKAPFEVPQQSFLLLDSKHGRCQSTPIWCAEEREESAA